MASIEGSIDDATKRQKTDTRPVLSPRLAEVLTILNDNSNETIDAYVNFTNSHEEEILQGLENAKDSETLGQDPLLLFKWNLAGLTCRVAVAAASGFVTPAGAPVSNADELRESLAVYLCNAPYAATDLGNNHDLFQFLPAHFLFGKMDALLTTNLWLRHHAFGWVAPAAMIPPPNTHLWPDIVDYCQVITITKANAVVGPTNCALYFNT